MFVNNHPLLLSTVYHYIKKITFSVAQGHRNVRRTWSIKGLSHIVFFVLISVF